MRPAGPRGAVTALAAPTARTAARDDAVEAVVLVPTFRRPAMLADTLASLAGQRGGRRFAVLVADNDAAGREGLAEAERVFAGGALGGEALVEPRQGHCNGCNALFRAARARWPRATYFLMIDDDEVASPDWLDRLVGTAEATGADLVGGPVQSRFTGPASRAMRSHPVFHPAYARSGPVPRIHGSGNFLIRQAALARLAAPEFDTGFDHLGGGDADFFLRCTRAGLRSHWDNEAVITETVPPARTTIAWVLRRSLRIGAVNLRIEQRDAGRGLRRLKPHLKTVAALPLGLARGALCLLRTGSPLLASHRPVMALGRALAAVGVVTEQYRASPRP